MFAGLDCRTREDDAVDLFRLQGLHCERHREVALARAGGPIANVIVCSRTAST